MLTGRDGFRAQPVVSRARLEGAGEKFDIPFFFVVRFHGNDNNRPQSPRWFQVYFTSPNIDGLPSSASIQML